MISLWFLVACNESNEDESNTEMLAVIAPLFSIRMFWGIKT